MAFKLSGPEGTFAGLAALNLNEKSWTAQFDGGKDSHPVTAYGHGAEGAVVWMRFTVQQGGASEVVEGEWDLLANKQTIKTGPTAGNLTVQSQTPFNKHPFIDPGIDDNGTHVWLRYGAAGNKTKEYRFQTSVHVNLGKLGDILKVLKIVEPIHI